MKVLFLFEGLPHYYNDILNRLNDLHGVQVIVLVPRTNGRTLGKGVYQSEEGIQFSIIKDEEYQTFYGKPFFKNINKILNEIQPDIIISGWPYIQGFFIYRSLYQYVRRNNIKLVEKSIPYLLPKYEHAWSYYSSGKHISNEDDSFEHKINTISSIKYFILTQFRKWYLPKLDAHVCYVEEAFTILESYGVSKEKIFIIYNSPDTEKIFAVKKVILDLPPLLPKNRFRLIHVGRLVRWKKVHLLINVIKKLCIHFPEIELLVIGHGPEESNLKQQSIDLGIERYVRFTGGVYLPEELGRYFVTSSLYVLAGVGGLSINEAMCYGKPIICSECDGTEKKLVRDEFNGKYFINNDEEDLYEKIYYLLERPKLMEKMGKNSLEIIHNEINVHTVIKGYYNALTYITAPSI